MASQINPQNINGAFPVAGQDNNSQGFRDNFTNTQNNFQFAANEISDLQNKAIVNSQLSGGAILTTQNNMLGSPLINALISDFAASAISLGVVGGAVNINYQAGHYQTLTTDNPVTLGFTNFPSAGQMGLVSVQITVSNVVHTVTLPGSVTLGTQGIQGYASGNNTITFAQTGVYTFTFTTSDGGSTVTIIDQTRPLSYYTNNVTIANGGNLSVTGLIYGNVVGNISGNLIAPGSNTQVIFNTNGSANASSNFTFNTATNALTVAGNITGSYILGNGALLTGLSGTSLSGNMTGNILANTFTINNLPGLSVTGNVAAGNINMLGAISTTGNVRGGNILSGSILSAAGTIATGTNIVALGSISAGTTITAQSNLTVQGVALLTSSESLAATNPVSLAVTTSYFTTGAAETATLAAGANGQIKILVAEDISLGNMVITVADAGWKTSGSGTITFGTIGSACTLQCVVGKWFCIGNNGAVFA